MKLEKIITLANSKVHIQFLAMERSLRKTGCTLPLWVIPYDDSDKFELPSNAIWWELPEVLNWLKENKSHPTMRKYQCLLTENYQFVDADVIFLSNPGKVLEKLHGFVTSCGHWHNPGHTYTSQSLSFLKKKSSLWQKHVFNTGQFACDQTLFTFEELKITTESENFKYTCVSFPYHEQPGVNLLVNSTDVLIQNLTLPPFNMESTWAGDYPEENFDSIWTDGNKPYLIHWAGCNKNPDLHINRLFYEYLTEEEKKAWLEELRLKKKGEKHAGNILLRILKKF